MPSCHSCGADRAAVATGEPCPKCGAKPAADFELDVPRRAPPQAAARKKEEEPELKLELAVDPRAAFAAPPAAAPAPPAPTAAATALVRGGSSALAARAPRGAVVAGAAVGEVAFDARLLAEYGDPPRHWILSPLYAWRVLARQRVLKRALVGRRDEAKRAAHEVEDALVAFAERVRPAAEKHAEFARGLEELRGAEDVLRSRDRVLASEQDAQSARLAAVDARLAKLEAELAHAQTGERAIAAELASSQAALARGESKLKRAESELRAAQQRETDGSQA
jgi:hypothetical protein